VTGGQAEAAGVLLKIAVSEVKCLEDDAWSASWVDVEEERAPPRRCALDRA
jgi:hypothetical protein